MRFPVDGASGDEQPATSNCKRADDTIENMVKGITLVTQVASAAALEKLAGLFGALGFEAGKGWEDGGGRGAAFLAPLGNLELVAGRAPAVPPILIEVTQLDQVRAVVEQWMMANYSAEEVGNGSLRLRLRTGTRGCLRLRWTHRYWLASGSRRTHCTASPSLSRAICPRRECGLRLWLRAGTR